MKDIYLKYEKLRLLVWLFGGTVGISLLVSAFSQKKTNFEEIAFTHETYSHMASVDNYSIHCFDSRDASSCLEGVEARKAENVVLWLGNSQVHGVNQLQPGQTNASPILFRKLKKYDLDLITFSEPNANLQEHLVLFEYLRKKLPVTTLILPVVFDDMRENNIRKEIAVWALDSGTKDSLLRNTIGSNIINVAQQSFDTGETAGIASTIQEKVELAINEWLENNSRIWETRPEVRGQIFLALYKLRNTVFGIKPSSKRKVIPGHYANNLSAMEAILSSAEKLGIRVLVYVVPLRSDVATPYVPAEYEKFKGDVLQLSAKYNALFANLENLVPSEYWGSKNSVNLGKANETDELDFMHFQAAGHKLLAKALEKYVLELIDGKKELGNIE